MGNLFFKDGKPYYTNEAEVKCQSGGKSCVVEIEADVTEIINACKEILRGKGNDWTLEEYSLARQISYNWTKMSETAKKLGIKTARFGKVNENKEEVK